MAQDEKTIYVYENWRGEAPTLLGRLRCGFVRGQETFSFEYDPAWLSSAESSFSLDPDLALYRGRQYVPLNKQLFGLFSDSCPDRWGRLLMKRKEAIDARKEDRKPRKLTESDFLLGVYDESRMGALRFSLEEGGEFLSNDKAFATPPWVNLRTLENASIAFENDESGLNENGCVSFWPPAPPWEAQDPKLRCRPQMAPCGLPSSLPSMMNITAARGRRSSMTWHGSADWMFRNPNWRRSPRPAVPFSSSDLTETAAAASTSPPP